MNEATLYAIADVMVIAGVLLAALVVLVAYWTK